MTSVRTGLEALLQDRINILSGLRVGVIANPASVNSRLEHIVDLLWNQSSIRLTCILGPQHGARGETQDNMIEWEDYRDHETGLPVFSLYGKTRRPTREMLAEVDALVFDVQDVGARYYTFIYTMALAMEACAEAGKRIIVLDRPNPINGIDVEGNVGSPDFRSFVGLYPLAVRHGLTVGELALLFNREYGLECELEVIPMEGWRREMYFEETGLPWVLPSPNIPTVASTMVYPGLCPLEGTNISEGRGTTRPFEISGAPWIDPNALVRRLEVLKLPGARFRPLHFIPTFHKWSGQMIGGVQIHVQDRHLYRPFRTGLALLKSYRELGREEFAWNPPPYEYEHEKLPIDILLGSDKPRKMLEEGCEIEELEASWSQELAAFRQTREQYLLY